MNCLQPLCTGIGILVQDASTFGTTVASGSTRTAGVKVSGVAKDQSIINVVLGLTIVVVEAILEGFAVITDLRAVWTSGELGLVAVSVLVLAILANVVGKFTVHSLQISR